MPGETLLDSALMFCTTCQQAELAWYTARVDGVFLSTVCPVAGERSAKIAADVDWFITRMGNWQPVSCDGTLPIERGCPFDCGLCQFHTGGLRLPVFSITNACNLDCPICFTFNRPDQLYFKSHTDMTLIVDHIIEQAGSVDLINITGGEPTLHPQLFELIDTCNRVEIGRITLNTNGLRLANNPDFARKIKDTGVQIVLSLDTFDPDTSRLIHGVDLVAKKRRALEILEELDIPTTILSVCIKNVNEDDVNDIVHSYFPRNFVRSITIQNMTFTGQNGSQFVNGPVDQPRVHITMDEVEVLLSQRDMFHCQDFFPLGAYHPLCYSVAYYIVYKDRIFSLSRLIDPNLLVEASRSSYLLNPSNKLARRFLDGVNQLWAKGEDPEFIRVLREFFNKLYPTDKNLNSRERARIAEGLIKPIYIHPHMDADNFDIGRVSCCGDVVPDESGRMIPACAYNLVHRQKDPRFWIAQTA
jgi:uncharacterized radical SAM superfamily Fe-S cluster-containing enzyme